MGRRTTQDDAVCAGREPCGCAIGGPKTHHADMHHRHRAHATRAECAAQLKARLTCSSCVCEAIRCSRCLYIQGSSLAPRPMPPLARRQGRIWAWAGASMASLDSQPQLKASPDPRAAPLLPPCARARTRVATRRGPLTFDHVPLAVGAHESTVRVAFRMALARARAATCARRASLTSSTLASVSRLCSQPP